MKKLLPVFCNQKKQTKNNKIMTSESISQSGNFSLVFVEKNHQKMAPILLIHLFRFENDTQARFNEDCDFFFI